MTWKTHLIGGAQAGVLLACAAGGSAVDSAVIASAALLGSVLPDIDHSRSKLSRGDSLVGLLSRLTTKFTRHRGFTHTIPGAFLFGLLFYALAMFRTERQSLISFFAAFAVFFIIHMGGGRASRFAGWIAVAVYAAGPQIATLLTEHSIKINVNGRSAWLCAAGIIAGCASHILFDLFNKGGIMLLWPFSKKTVRLMKIKTNTAGEFWFAAAQILVLALILVVCLRDSGLFERAGALFFGQFSNVNPL